MQIDTATTVTATLAAAKAVECGFDPQGTAHLMSVLTNMYRDASLAVLREYAANARDAHIEAGNPDPIHVTLPTEWEPTLTITDHGVGLTEAQILAVYSRYGASSKRETNTQVGAFGIGAKSAFTLANQFVVTGIRDGVKTVALFAINAAGVPTVEINDRSRTDEANGVTITVPVEDPAAMRRAADQLFSVWTPGTVLVDGKPPHYLPAEMLHITDTLYADHRGVVGRPGTQNRQGSTTAVTLVMGGIPYPASVSMLVTIARDLADNHAAASSLAAALARGNMSLRLLGIVDVGAVDITPSREDLRDTARTITVLSKLITDYLAQVEPAVRRAINAEPSPAHAAARVADLHRYMPTLPYKATWQGQRLQKEIQLPFPVRSRNGRGTMLVTDFTLTLLHDLTQMQVITGVDVDSEKTVRRLANRYLSHHNHGVKYLIMVPNQQGNVAWFAYGKDSAVSTVDLAEFVAAAKALPTISRPRSEVHYQVHQDSGTVSMSCSDLKAAAEQPGARLLLLDDSCLSASQVEFCRILLPESDILVSLTGQQIESAFLRRFPKAVKATVIIRKHAQQFLDAMSEKERLALEHQDSYLLDKIVDIPELRELPPLRPLADAYLAGREAARTVRTRRLHHLAEARRIVHGPPTTQRHSIATGSPLLDAVLNQLTAGPLPSHFGPDLYADLHRHITTFHADSPAAA